MTRGRRKSEPTPQAPEPAINDKALQRSEAAATELARLQDVADDNAKALAVQLGYEGSLTVSALEDQVRFYQRRTAEAMVGLGASLLLLKELTPHGDFSGRVAALGFSERSAQRFMSATLKFSKTANLAVLTEKAGSQSKLLELAVLDDGEVEQLTKGGTVRGVTLDRVETMSVSELKAALRQSEHDAAFEAEKRQKAEAKRDQLEKRLRGKVPEVAPLDDRLAPFQKEITERHSLMESLVIADIESIKALDAWYQEQIEQDPDASGPMPVEAQAVLMHLADSIERMARWVGTAQHTLVERFAGDIQHARQYLLRDPGGESPAPAGT